MTERKLTGHSPPDPAFSGMTPDELEEQIEIYFEGLEEWDEEVIFTMERNQATDEVQEVRKVRPYLKRENPPTMAGLALHLGVTRMTLWTRLNKGDEDDPLLPVLSRGVTKLAAWTEAALYDRHKARGAMFSLAVNHRYGKEEQEGGAGGTFTQNVLPPAPEEDRKAVAVFKEGEEDAG